MTTAAEAWICRTCANQCEPSDRPPAVCAICADERQYLGPDGQQWTTAGELAGDHHTTVRPLEPGLTGIGLEPSIGIGQRALLVQTPAGNLLWDCLPLVDAAGRAQIEDLGGVDVIAISHPHFYAAYVDIAETFDAHVVLPSADLRWRQRSSDRVVSFDRQVEPLPGLTIRAVGGHFDGSSVLHWAAGADGAGVLLTGDTITVVPDHRWVSFMWSYPNLLPLDEATVLRIAANVADLAFDRIYGGWWRSVVPRAGSDVVRRSADRYAARLRGERRE